VTIAAPERCGRYLGYVLTDVKVGPSPLWLRVRLHRLGLRSDLQRRRHHQPRADSSSASRCTPSTAASWRRAGWWSARPPEEALRTLDGSDRSLDRDDLVIADADDAQALAGVMGGAVIDGRPRQTRAAARGRLVRPPGVRASARRHGLGTDASYRFERGVDHGAGLERAACGP
jgi:phenylalanyl-tRNA synthetase beta chain